MSFSFKIERSSTTATTTNKRPSTQNNSRQNSNHLNPDSSDEDHHADEHRNRKKRPIEFISDFDSTRESTNPHGRTKQQMISIPALPDRDFRAIDLARKQKRAQKELYRPEPVNSMGGAPKKQSNQDNIDTEGLDKMNSKVIEGGLKAPPTLKSTRKIEEHVPESESIEAVEIFETVISTTTDKPLTIEERAVKELLSQANADSTNQPKIEAIPMRNEARQDTGSDGVEEEDEGDDSGESGDETAQFRKDVSKRPDSSTLEDYERIPVGQFGLALLKGMGWKEGTAATKRGRAGLVEAYVPQARPSLLGIGAKPLVLDGEPADKYKVKPISHKDTKYKDEKHRGERYKEERNKDGRYKDERYKEERFKDERYKEERYKEERCKEERYKEERYKDRKYTEGKSERRRR
ncbi:hypothetical protein PGT21_002575 [Puccinia graminis f. sp. tritici]|uniref:Spp2/MOS2 G-patch domain-containing protein n=1 Tax=Puccinia graminis f. sp. tritici TaxID=56615 RepID=A0A5B0SKH9_PUCGR|nr:hypothetical protein PGT21_002575 [Puccinia graminis f. sp. tritici]KAA1137859.1 hypothetical protein PGTUg99_026037 [Puccinia graminis f. sp. tritici]